jgi:hypothetical protein
MAVHRSFLSIIQDGCTAGISHLGEIAISQVANLAQGPDSFGKSPTI